MRATPLFSILLYLVLSIFANSAVAQDTLLHRADQGLLDSLNSSVLKEKRFIEVILPDHIKLGSTEKYDVLYILDGGNYNTAMINQIQQYLQAEKYIPPTIIISVIGIDRSKDFTPTKGNGYATSGGADQFLEFLKTELIPFVNKKYPSNGDNTIWGHSLGGLFVIHTLLHQPNLFKGYIAVDPSLWWNNEYINRIAQQKLSSITDINATLFISGREGFEGESMKISTMINMLKRSSPNGLKWKSIDYPEESHSSLRLKSTYDGLKFSYAWNSNPMQMHPMAGTILKSRPIKVWYFNDTTKVRYTLDGTEPTINSPTIPREISLNESLNLKVRQFTNRSRYDKIKTGNYKYGKALLPTSLPKNAAPGGFNYAYYEDNWDLSTNLKNLTPALQGLADTDFQIENLPRKNNFALVIDGMIEAKEDGYYIFVWEADTGSKLYLKNQLLIQWEGSLSSKTASYIVPLKKGFYPIRIEYLHKNADHRYRLTYLPPSSFPTKNLTPIPLDIQYHIGKK